MYFISGQKFFTPNYLIIGSILCSRRKIVSILIRARRCKSTGKGEVKMKVFVQKRNPLTGSTEWDIGVDHDEYDYHQEIARSAFADMLHDTERNKMYYKALQLAVEKMHHDGKKANVLDIGTGTGLLSMMAAKCGADTITACEAFKPMAECCLNILQQNGVADKIKVIPKRSTEIIVGEGGDMEKRANILVTEVFDTELIGEGALSTFSHAHLYLLEEDCIVIPDSAVIYAQVVECPFLQRWNKLEDVAAPELGVLLETPQKMRECGGSGGVHDLQLSQLPRGAFRDLSGALPVLRYHWGGRSPTDLRTRRVEKRRLTALAAGAAHAVFMWWDLIMDTEGKIVVSCAPWWAHAGADVGAQHPGDSVPWRDHWMQAVYYLPRETRLAHTQEYTLVSCQDEYSLWFYIEGEGEGVPHCPPCERGRPVCECGVHMAWSRTHLSYINDTRHGQTLRNLIKQEVSSDSVVLDLNGSSLLGLVAAKIATKVYIYETSTLNRNILKDYMKANDISNVELLEEMREDVLAEVTNVVWEPVRASSILPWEDLQAAHHLYRWRAGLGGARVAGLRCELWAAPMEFLHLHKTRVPVRTCEGFDVTIFDRLVEESRRVSDAEVEAQPLWEYPGRSAGRPRRLLALHMPHLQRNYAADNTFTLCEWSGAGEEPRYVVNGFALWAAWGVGDVDGGEGEEEARARCGERARWDPHTRQAVTILECPRTVKASAQWGYEVACDLHTGHFHVSVRLLSADL